MADRHASLTARLCPILCPIARSWKQHRAAGSARLLDGRPDHTINQIVQDLRLLHRIRVGNLRGSKERDAHGYFLCLTSREVDVTVGQRLAEVRSSLEVINALKGGLSHALAEVNGQLRLLFGGKA